MYMEEGARTQASERPWPVRRVVPARSVSAGSWTRPVVRGWAAARTPSRARRSPGPAAW